MIDEEITAWRSPWLAESEPAPLPDIRKIVDRDRRRMARHLGSQFLVGIALLGFSAWWAWWRHSLEWLLWAAVIWILTFFAGSFAVRNAAGNWSSTEESTAAFVELTRRRVKAALSAIRFGRKLLALEIAIVVPWLSWDFARRRLPLTNYAIGLALTAALTATYLLVFARVERNRTRELEGLERFENVPSV
jgi:hypothetical protein